MKGRGRLLVLLAAALRAAPASAGASPVCTTVDGAPAATSESLVLGMREQIEARDAAGLQKFLDTGQTLLLIGGHRGRGAPAPPRAGAREGPSRRAPALLLDPRERDRLQRRGTRPPPSPERASRRMCARAASTRSQRLPQVCVVRERDTHARRRFSQASSRPPGARRDGRDPARGTEGRWSSTRCTSASRGACTAGRCGAPRVRADAEDLIQDTFLAIHGSLPELPGRERRSTPGCSGWRATSGASKRARARAAKRCRPRVSLDDVDPDRSWSTNARPPYELEAEPALARVEPRAERARRRDWSRLVDYATRAHRPGTLEAETGLSRVASVPHRATARAARCDGAQRVEGDARWQAGGGAAGTPRRLWEHGAPRHGTAGSAAHPAVVAPLLRGLL